MQEFIPLHVHSMYSLLDGLSKPYKIAERCIKLGYNACAISDHGSVSGCIQFIKACKESCKCGHQKGIHDSGKRCLIKNCTCEAFDKSNIKPILGCEFYLSQQDPAIKERSNRKLSHLVVLAKNLQGWKNLIKATSSANDPDHVWYDKPRLNLEKLADFSKGKFICFSGHMGSDMANVCFAEPSLAYKAKTYEEAKLLVRTDWKEAVLNLAGKYQELFGKGNFYLECQRIDYKNLPASDIVYKIMGWAGKKLGIPCVATPDAHYPTKEDAPDQRVELCAQLKTTLNAVQRKLDTDEDVTLGGFFRSNNYHIPSLTEMMEIHQDDELKSSIEIAEKCEVYDVSGKPILPSFNCPDGLSPDEYMKRLCNSGWKQNIEPLLTNDSKRKTYTERLRYELDVIFNAGLSGYFLVVQDYINYAKQQGWLVGPGRGSSAGCLVSNLIGITSIDPIEYDLMFERFYNAGRNTKDRISYPDIDTDFPQAHRDEVLAYVSRTYGHDKVAQMITFGRMQGKSAIKNIFRVHEACSITEMNELSKLIPADSQISGDLEEMRKATGESSIIRWALENNAEGLRKWCYINKDGELEGEHKFLFEQAIRMEGTKTNKSKHASGVVMAPIPLAEVCPMVYDNKENTVVAGFEMNDLEAIGLIKFDILGVTTLDRISGVINLLDKGVLC
jgi:DNA polymerase-3 subunit alpha